MQTASLLIRRLQGRLLSFVCSLFLLSLFAESAHAQDLAELYSSEGSVEARVAPATDWKAITTGQKFAQHDAVRTLENSRAGIKFSTGYLVRMKEKTVISFDQAAAGEKKDRLSVIEGIGHFFSRKPKEFPEINTPHVSASVRGTEFTVAVGGDVTTISVLDGAVDAENQYGAVSLGKGDQAVVHAGSAPVKQIMVRPNDAVQWALYYPAVFQVSDFADFTAKANHRALDALNSGDLAAAENEFRGYTWVDGFGRAIVAYRRGETSKALDILRGYPLDRPAGMLLLEASILLSTGDVDGANKILEQTERVLPYMPKDAQPKLRALFYAQKSVIALVGGNKEEADRLATAAEKEDPDSAAAAFALSFVRQSQFRLDEAEAYLRTTTQLEPANGVASARLAELLMGFGKRDEAIEVAEAALEKDPNNAYVLSVLGFAELTSYHTDEAAGYFKRAIKAESGFALPRLGLGLTEIRQGNLAGGRELLEQAAVLDPTVSIYRSYLGKAFFEEDKEDMSEHEYNRAIDLDPLDPTPYLYRSFTRLADHRPIEALEDLQESIERNDNRAVYRSRLLLDQDQGTRSSSLGQVYNRIGFTELARVESIRSLNHDYSNYSAHFLLADLYRDTHLNSRAQVTENLLGRLLSPVTFNSNNVNIGGEASLNEYTTLFDRPQQRGNLDALVDSQTDTIGGRASYTMNTEKLGFNLGYAGSYRDGFRENDFQRSHQLFNLGQYALSEDDTLVWDAAVTANDQGDVIQNFDPHLEDEDFESKFDGALVRAGYHRRLGPGAHLVGQAFYNYGDFDGKNDLNGQRLSFLNVNEAGVPVNTDPLALDAKTDEDTDVEQHLARADLQIIWDTEPVSIVLGTSASTEHLDSNEDAIISNSGSEPVLSFIQGMPIVSGSTVDEYSSQNFLYSTFHATPWLDLDAGLVYSWLKYGDNSFVTPYAEDTYEKDQWGPKAGAVVQLCDAASLRFAFSRSLDRTGRGGLGPLEPTFVGGFNQVYDGVRGSEQDLYGSGIDIKLSRKTYTGINYQRRNVDFDVPIVAGGLDVSRPDLTSTQTTMLARSTGEAEIDRVNTYLYQIFTTQFAGVLDYNFERFNENDPFPETQTNRLAGRLNYFHPSGLFAFSGAAFRYQERAGVSDAKTTEDFWTLDAGVGYEFDHRHGALTLRFDNILDRDFNYSAIADEDAVIPRFGAKLALTLSY